mmetsp:Transcript_13715/g.35499  ORF Transcript_13715/g.35499 Transcript_13715/m.35499 type:complete len:109 (+) Transcript_13715:117-443(+)
MSWLPQLSMGGKQFAQGEKLTSPVFALGGRSGFKLVVYPKGESESTGGFCSAYVQVPSAGSYQLLLTVAGQVRKLLHTFSEQSLIGGVRDFVTEPNNFDHECLIELLS